ncbi:MAG: hypothetical protein PHV30_08585, partial [Candidatus Margulisbacteria bacterium]|nr:hypothetical protein [Candidatus Margulisiibacteriota bacterium]
MSAMKNKLIAEQVSGISPQEINKNLGIVLNFISPSFDPAENAITESSKALGGEDFKQFFTKIFDKASSYWEDTLPFLILKTLTICKKEAPEKVNELLNIIGKSLTRVHYYEKRLMEEGLMRKVIDRMMMAETTKEEHFYFLIQGIYKQFYASKPWHGQNNFDYGAVNFIYDIRHYRSMLTSKAEQQDFEKAVSRVKQEISPMY